MMYTMTTALDLPNGEQREVEVEFSVEAGERECFDYPAIPATVFVVSVTDAETGEDVMTTHEQEIEILASAWNYACEQSSARSDDF